MGSVEWVEEHAASLQAKAVVYINSDGNGRGFLGAEGSHAFTGLMTDISKSIQDPQTGVTIFERQRANRATEATTTTKEVRNLLRNLLDVFPSTGSSW
jgi:N-acetylated-alpha-linked acidic dipeptidase